MKWNCPAQLFVFISADLLNYIDFQFKTFIMNFMDFTTFIHLVYFVFISGKNYLAFWKSCKKKDIVKDAIRNIICILQQVM